ncbi:hypothetical protein L9F63_014174, partial [Diploptera punctata]
VTVKTSTADSAQEKSFITADLAEPHQWSTLHSVGTAIRGKHITRILQNGNSDGLNQRRPQ